ncbi:MAG: hypothetical protein IID37_02515 [Planctomycetes bacterium]|nr:hypothetical protein [Planctomycetota bacterium]
MLRKLLLLLLSVFCMITTTVTADDIRVPPPNPKEPVDYIKWINDTMSARVTENAAELYAQVNTDILTYHAGVLATSEEEAKRARKAEDHWTLPLRALRGPWGGGEFKPLEAWLAANSKNLKLIHEGSQRSGLFFELTPAEDSDDFVELAPLAQLRGMAKLLITAGWAHVARGHPDRMCENALTAIRLGHQAEMLPFAIDRLVAVMCAQLGYDALIRTLEHADSPSQLASEFMERIVDADRTWSSLETVYQMEKPWFYHFLQGIYRWDPSQQRLRLDEPKARRLVAEFEKWAVLSSLPPGDDQASGDRAKNGVVNSPTEDRLKWSRIEFGATLREGNQHFDALIEWAKQRYDDALRNADRIERGPAQSTNRLVRTCCSNLTRTRYIQERVIATQHAAHTIYAIWAYHHKRGVFPSRLSAARSPGGREMQADPFSGHSLVYKRTRDGFTLYSVGLDQDDDGGRHHPQFGEFIDGKKPDGDYVFWPPVPLEPY